MSGRIVSPEGIERESFRIIEEELGERDFPPLVKPVVLRVIHATADFSFADSLVFSEGALERGLAALRAGATVVTDTTMALSGLSKPALEALGCRAVCFIGDKDVAEEARSGGGTRSRSSMDKAATLQGPLLFAIGNAPTALMRVCELVEEGRLSPELVVGVPVGFVNVVESKEELLAHSDVPSIVARGRKGGSTVAVAIVNALLYELTRDAGGGKR